MGSNYSLSHLHVAKNEESIIAYYRIEDGDGGSGDTSGMTDSEIDSVRKLKASYAIQVEQGADYLTTSINCAEAVVFSDDFLKICYGWFEEKPHGIEFITLRGDDSRWAYYLSGRQVTVKDFRPVART